MTSARDVEIVTGLRRRLANADPATLTNFAWFASRRGVSAVALEAVRHAVQDPRAPAAARRTLERLASGRLDGLLLTDPLPERDLAPAPRPAVPRADLSEAELLERGRQLLESGHLSDALLAFDRLLLAHPTQTAALFHRGVVLAKLRRYGEALHAWEAVGHADPDGPLGAISRRHARSARQLASLFGAS